MTVKNLDHWGRHKARERYAEGGDVLDNMSMDVGSKADTRLGWAKQDLDNVMTRHRPDEFWDGGVQVPGKLAAKNEEYLRKQAGKRRGGRVKK